MLAQHNHLPPSHPANHASRRIASPLPGAHRMRNAYTVNSDDAASASAASATDKGPDSAEVTGEDNPRLAESRERYERYAARIPALLDADSVPDWDLADDEADGAADMERTASSHAQNGTAMPGARQPARKINEDDYGDDEDDEEDAMDISAVSPLKAANAQPPISIPKTPSFPSHLSTDRKATPSLSDTGKSSDDLRKRLQEDRKALEDKAKASFHEFYYTLEYDRDAMLEQQKLDELDRQVEADMSNQDAVAATNANSTQSQQGTLSSANLGASSLTLKHLIARIDSKRHMIQASDAQLRTLISEVRKNRSKWANEDKVGQEELYEAAEKVLMELKAMTEHSGPFLQRVNKRDAPDYYNIIKHPMDIGTMIKKLKSLQYKSKKDFVDDLSLIWTNCLRYNADPNHFLRKKALYMRKETEKLVPLIPDIVIRDRAEVEAEERRLQNGDHDLDGAEDSDDEPIMASRGRKAPKKGGPTTRKAPAADEESAPASDAKPSLPGHMGSSSNLRNEFLRSDSDVPMDGSRMSTPPGNTTPIGPNGVGATAGTAGSQADASELEAGASILGGAIGQHEDLDHEDLEFKTWKQVTKKDRAHFAAERNRLFQGDKLNVEEPASLRSRAGMRRWLRQHKRAIEQDSPSAGDAAADDMGRSRPAINTLAEGIEEEDDDSTLPDYYDAVNAIPELIPNLAWTDDSEGNPVFQVEEYLRTVPSGMFTSVESNLTKKMEANMRQMQETRKICAKIGIVKQMQLQSQIYQNQFQKYDPQPFHEQDIETHVVSTSGPVMAKATCQAALRRSVAKLFYHAGFEEYQPSVLDAATEIAAGFFQTLVKTLDMYRGLPKVKSENGLVSTYSAEQCILHALQENGSDIESLESYVRDDVDRLGSKLGVMHDRMRSHLAELMRPALDAAAGPDGVGAFNDDSEQFVAGDFAEEIDEDYLGLKELGLDKEFGLATLNVPLHLLQNRMHSAYQAQHATATTDVDQILPPPEPFEAVTIDNIGDQIGLVQTFFRRKLHENNEEALLEDDDLPAKQRFPKPRLPPTGKISSPRKRPPREVAQMQRKKRRLEEANQENANLLTNGNGSQQANGIGSKVLSKPVGKLKLDMPTHKDGANDGNQDDVGMMSPESITAG